MMSANGCVQSACCAKSQRAKDARNRNDDMEERMNQLMIAIERIADVAELWADKQVDAIQ
jgi:hypothetical protein